MKSRYLLILLATLVIFLSSCTEEGEETDYNPNVKSSRDYIFAEDIYFEIINIFFKGITDTSVVQGGYAYLDNCGIIYKPMEDKMVFEYGGVNRWCPDNKYRRGRFNATFYGPFFTQGSSVTFMTDSLFVDNHLVEAAMSAEFLGPDNGGKHQLTFVVTDGKITLNDTVNLSVIHYTSDFLLTWEMGQQTPYTHEDDMLLVTGNSSGISIDNIDFSLAIQEPLMNYLDCFWIASGNHRITVPSATVPEGTIDYIASDNCFYKVNFFFGESEFYDYLKF